MCVCIISHQAGKRLCRFADRLIDPGQPLAVAFQSSLQLCEVQILHGNRKSRGRRTASASARSLSSSSSRTSSLPPVPIDYDVLVVNDLPTTSPTLDRVRTSLEQAKVRVHGIAQGPLTERELEWLAEARKAAGIGPLFPAHAVERLQELLEVDEDLDAILWLSMGESGDEPVYRVVTPDTAPNAGGAYRVLR